MSRGKANTPATRRRSAVARALVAACALASGTTHAPGQDAAPSSASQGTGAPATKLGRFEMEVEELAFPSACAYLKDGRLAVVETYRHRVVLFDDLAQRVAEIGSPGSAPGELWFPKAIAADDDAIWVCDSGNDRIQRLSLNGTPEAVIATRGAGEGELCDPGGIALDNERLFVADTGNDRVQVFGKDGRWLTSFGETGRAEGQFNRPIGIACDADGHVYVADSLNNRVQKFRFEDGKAKFVRAWGGWGQFPGMLSTPTGVECSRGMVLVADSRNHRIQCFSPEGTYLHEWGLHIVKPHECEGRIHYPSAVAVRHDGARAAVCEPFERRAQVFGPVAEGTPPEAVATPFWERGAMSHFGQRLSADGPLMAVAEPDSQMVMIYDTRHPTPIQITTFGMDPGSTPRDAPPPFGSFNEPGAVVMDTDDLLVHVGDTGNRRLQVFRLNWQAEQPLAFDPAMAQFVRAYDLQELTARLRAAPGAPALAWPIEITAMSRSKANESFIADRRNRIVLVFDSEMNFLRGFGHEGPEEHRLRGPNDIALSPDGGTIFVADVLASRVSVFDREGKFLFHVGSIGEGHGRFLVPMYVAVDRSGDLYVSDPELEQIQKFRIAGNEVTLAGAWGRRGIARGEFFQLAGLALDAGDRLIASDYANHRLQFFSTSGQFLDWFGARSYTTGLPKQE